MEKDNKQSWPVYKGPIKKCYHRKDLPYDLKHHKRHENTYQPKHIANDYGWRLYQQHYQPRHAKKDYRYGKDGRIRKVIPNPMDNQKVQVTSQIMKQEDIYQCVDKSPPPRNFITFLYEGNEEPFDLEDYRKQRKILDWRQSWIQKNYARETAYGLLCVDLLFLILGFLTQNEFLSACFHIGSGLLLIPILFCTMYSIAHSIKKTSSIKEKDDEA